ncbi:aminotransferase class IV [Roseibium polysiphoniae]|uniref:aminotransferase class IV n=1 Tax=Roseibium polysiphoniae TaxID=2571221 RepID=UPI003296F948
MTRDGKLLTPAIEHGLLPGTLRAGLLKRGMAAEADLTLEDLQCAGEIYVGNSVRGLVPARLIDAKQS